MNHYQAKFLFHTFETLEIDRENSAKESDARIEIKELKTSNLHSSLYNVTLSFYAADNVEALHLSAINTDQSLLVLKGSGMLSYKVTLIEKKWLGNKVLEDQFLMYGSLSVSEKQLQEKPKHQLAQQLPN